MVKILVGENHQGQENVHYLTDYAAFIVKTDDIYHLCLIENRSNSIISFSADGIDIISNYNDIESYIADYYIDGEIFLLYEDYNDFIIHFSENTGVRQIELKGED